MSAFLLDEKHITCMVATAILGPKGARRHTWYPPSGEHCWTGMSGTLCASDADQLGRLLWTENLRSVTARYPDATDLRDAWAEPTATYTAPAFLERYRLEPVAALKALHCYEYQSCETDDWKRTTAAKFCRDFRRSLISTLPGYDMAPWAISDLD